MRFSWTGLLLAPLLVPLVFCAVMLGFPQTLSSVFLFLILLVPSCLVSYGTTIFLLLPTLFLLSLWRPMTGLKVCLLGLVLGAVVYVPLTWMEWKSSGPDFGTSGRKLRGVLSALGRRSDHGPVSPGWAGDGGALLAAGDAAPYSTINSGVLELIAGSAGTDG